MLENAGFDDVIAEDQTNLVCHILWNTFLDIHSHFIVLELLQQILFVSVLENSTNRVKCPWEQEGWFHWWFLWGGLLLMHFLF
jgi:hypothetical protein